MFQIYWYFVNIETKKSSFEWGKKKIKKPTSGGKKNVVLERLGWGCLDFLHFWCQQGSRLCGHHNSDKIPCLSYCIRNGHGKPPASRSWSPQRLISTGHRRLGEWSREVHTGALGERTLRSWCTAKCPNPASWGTHGTNHIDSEEKALYARFHLVSA